MQNQSHHHFDYFQLSEAASSAIKKELRIIKNPILLILQQGTIQAVLEGIIAPHQLEKALNQITSPVASL